MADQDLELRGGGGGGFLSPALPACLPSAILFSLPEIRREETGVEVLNVTTFGLKCNKALNVITFGPKCNKPPMQSFNCANIEMLK